MNSINHSNTHHSKAMIKIIFIINFAKRVQVTSILAFDNKHLSVLKLNNNNSINRFLIDVMSNGDLCRISPTVV